ncbi:MAG: hypothetical protein ACRERC_03930 [Candidatus Binatia bacterium]
MTATVVTLLVTIHLAATLWHGGAHEALAIGLSPLQNLFVYAVILLAPLVAAGLVWTHYRRAALWLFTLSMLGAFLFGVYHHYILVSPDNVAHLPPGSTHDHVQFVRSAATIAGLELVSFVYGAYSLRRG